MMAQKSSLNVASRRATLRGPLLDGSGPLRIVAMPWQHLPPHCAGRDQHLQGELGSGDSRTVSGQAALQDPAERLHSSHGIATSLPWHPGRRPAISCSFIFAGQENASRTAFTSRAPGQSGVRPGPPHRHVWPIVSLWFSSLPRSALNLGEARHDVFLQSPRSSS